MSFKVTGVVLVALCGLYFSYNVKRRYDKRIKVLETFSKEFEFFISEISFLMTPVNEIILKLRKTENEKIYEYLLSGSTDKLRKGLSDGDYCLVNKDIDIICGFLKNLGMSDYENQINTLKSYLELIKTQIKDAKLNKEKNQKALTSLTMCGFIMIIIFLV